MYVYIFEDGMVVKTKEQPSEDALAAASDGILQILHFVEGDVFDLDSEGPSEVVEKKSWPEEA